MPLQPGQTANPNGRPNKKRLALISNRLKMHEAEFVRELRAAYTSNDPKMKVQALRLFAELRWGKAGQPQAAPNALAAVQVNVPEWARKQLGVSSIIGPNGSGNAFATSAPSNTTTENVAALANPDNNVID